MSIMVPFLNRLPSLHSYVNGAIGKITKDEEKRAEYKAKITKVAISCFSTVAFASVFYYSCQAFQTNDLSKMTSQLPLGIGPRPDVPLPNQFIDNPTQLTCDVTQPLESAPLETWLPSLFPPVITFDRVQSCIPFALTLAATNSNKSSSQQAVGIQPEPRSILLKQVDDPKNNLTETPGKQKSASKDGGINEESSPDTFFGYKAIGGKGIGGKGIGGLCAVLILGSLLSTIRKRSPGKYKHVARRGENSPSVGPSTPIQSVSERAKSGCHSAPARLKSYGQRTPSAKNDSVKQDRGKTWRSPLDTSNKFSVLLSLDSEEDASDDEEALMYYTPDRSGVLHSPDSNEDSTNPDPEPLLFRTSTARLGDQGGRGLTSKIFSLSPIAPTPLHSRYQTSSTSMLKGQDESEAFQESYEQSFREASALISVLDISEEYAKVLMPVFEGMAQLFIRAIDNMLVLKDCKANDAVRTGFEKLLEVRSLAEAFIKKDRSASNSSNVEDESEAVSEKILNFIEDKAEQDPDKPTTVCNFLVWVNQLSLVLQRISDSYPHSLDDFTSDELKEDLEVVNQSGELLFIEFWNRMLESSQVKVMEPLEDSKGPVSVIPSFSDQSSDYSTVIY